MSYILDALRRSQREQRRGQPPDLRAVYREGPPPKGTGPRRWGPWAAAGIAVAVAVAAWVLWPRAPEIVGASAPAPPAPAAGQAAPRAPEARRGPVPETAAPGDPTPSRPAPEWGARRRGEIRSLAGEAVVREPQAGRAPEPAETTATPEAETPAPEPQAPPKPAEAAAPVPETASQPTAEAPAALPPNSAEPPPPSAAKTPAAPVRPFQKPAAAAPPGREEPPLITQLPLAVRTGLPKLEINGHVWSEDPAQRFVFINWKSFREGDRVGEGGPRLERITPEGVVVDFGTARALIPLQ